MKTCQQKNKHLESIFIVTGDFNHTNLKTILPKFYKYVDMQQQYPGSRSTLMFLEPLRWKLHLILDYLTTYPFS